MIHDRRMVQVTPSQTASASVSLRMSGCIFCSPFQIIQLGAFQDPLFGVYGQVSAQVRKICTKQNAINRHDVAQHAKHGIACSQSRIPIDATEHVSSGASFLATGDEPHLIDDCETRSKIRDRSSS